MVWGEVRVSFLSLEHERGGAGGGALRERGGRKSSEEEHHQARGGQRVCCRGHLRRKARFSVGEGEGVNWCAASARAMGAVGRRWLRGKAGVSIGEREGAPL